MIDILDKDKYINFKRIEKGWSQDTKYCITRNDGIKFLLRISPPEQYERKKAEFDIMRQVAALNIPMCLPLEFGTCSEGVYSIQSWINGQEAEELIPCLSEEQKYSYGITAGKIIRTIHSLPAPDTIESWSNRFNKKLDRNIKLYGEGEIKIQEDYSLIEYINTHRHLLDKRPQTFQHGDYHIGNMMFEKDILKIIDFNRFDYGDPWEEFNRIVWSAQTCPIFASGMVDGYFDKEPPMEFWELLALYIASNTLSSIFWSITFGQKEIDTMTSQSQDVISWYDQMRNPVPSWYKKI